MNKKTTFALFGCILIVSIIFKVVMSFYSPLQYTDADEAVVGIAAKHIMQNGEIPFFQLGHSFSGDMVVLSFIAIPFFLLFGISTFSLHIETIFLTTLVIITAFIVFSKIFNKKVALITALFLSFPSPVYLEFTRNTAYHLFPLILDLFLFFFFYLIFFKKHNSLRNFVIFGLLCAFSIWATEFSIPLILIFIIYWFITERRLIFKKEFHIYLISFFIGYFPTLIYNFTHNFSNFKHLFAESFIHKIVCNYRLFPNIVYCLDEPIPTDKNIFSFFGTKLPSFFGDSVFGYIPYLLFLISIAHIIYKNKERIYSIIQSFFRKNIKIKNIPIELIITFYILLFVFSFYIRGAGKPRYLLPIYPFAFLLISLFTINVYNKINKKYLKIIFISSIIIILPLINIKEALLFYKRPVSEISKINEVNNILLRNGIGYVYAEYWLKWPIIFESNEQIIASCDNMCFCLGEGRKSRYPKYEELVNKSDNYGYVIRKNSEYDKRFSAFILENNITYKKEEVENFLIYFSFSKEIRPWMINCTDNEIMYP